MILPFSIGCVSQSSVAVAEDRASAKKSSHQPDRTPSPRSRDADRESHKGNSSSAAAFLPLPPRPNLTAGFQRVIKGFRGLTSQLFTYKDDSDSDSGSDRELEIGFPTDVQHVGHIGWDGTNTNALSSMMAWDGYRRPPPQHQPATKAPPPPELIAMPSISLRQFQMAMAAQADEDDDDRHGYPTITASHRHLRTAAA